MSGQGVKMQSLDAATDGQPDSNAYDVVVDLCGRSGEINDDTELLSVHLTDGPRPVDGDCEFNTFADAASSVLEQLAHDERVLIRCRRGESKAASVQIAVVGVHYGITYDEAYDIVREQRDDIRPHPKLVDHAKRFIDLMRPSPQGHAL